MRDDMSRYIAELADASHRLRSQWRDTCEEWDDQVRAVLEDRFINVFEYEVVRCLKELEQFEDTWHRFEHDIGGRLG